MNLPLIYLLAAAAFAALLLAYIIINMIKPIRDLAKEAEAAAAGAEREIKVRGGTSARIMGEALKKLISRLHTYVFMNERYGMLLDIYTRLHLALYQNNKLEDVFDETVLLLCECFNAKNIRLVIIRDGKAQTHSGEDFPFHNQAAALVQGKRIFYCNAYGIRERRISFAGEDAANLCILPFARNEILLGYIIMEGGEQTELFIHNDSELLFLSETLSLMLSRQPAGPSGTIEGLDRETGMELTGNNEKEYDRLLRISSAVFREEAKKMRLDYREKTGEFAIAIHGVKGSLYNIGAQALGDRALELEKAAKNGDVAFCEKTYPAFEKDLLALAEGIETSFSAAGTKAGKKSPSDAEGLAGILENAKDALKRYDLVKAQEMLAPFMEQAWKGRTAAALEKLNSALDQVEYGIALEALEEIRAAVTGKEDGA